MIPLALMYLAAWTIIVASSYSIGRNVKQPGDFMQQLSTHLIKVFGEAYELIRTGQLKTFIPFLTLFKLNGQTMNLERHFQFAPMFNTVQAPNTVWMFGRQLGKSFQLSGGSIIRSALIPFYHQLIIQPRSDQIQRLNATVYQPLLGSCIIREAFIPNLEASKLALKTYRNGSLTFMEHIFANPDRIRGISGAASCLIDEVQDIEYDFIPIANETMSASLFWGFSIYTGTPKTTDTTLALLWNRSSQAEWVIQCKACNEYNVPNPDHHLLNMIGKHGPVCHKCGRPVDPRNGGYVHAFPERALSFPGYHVSQTIHPLHMINDAKWGRILEKVGSYRDVELYNEVFGWPYDAATSPLNLSDLINAEFDPLDENGNIVDIQRPEDVLRIRHLYKYLTVGVDWSGGGMISDSYTSYAILGMRPDGQTIDVLYGKRIPKGVSAVDEANEIMTWIRGCHANAFAYDNGGAGFTRLEMMKQAGLMSVDGLIVVPIQYVRPGGGDVMKPRTGQREPDMYYYTLDKSRSMAICVTSLKMQKIRLRRFKHDDQDAYQRDFLALREDPRQSLGNETVIFIIKKPGVPDDFAHAVNFGCSQIWDHFGAYPRIGSRYDTSIVDYDENHQHIMDDSEFGPRGDFERFEYAVQSRADMEDYSNGVVFPDENPFGDY